MCYNLIIYKQLIKLPLFNLQVLKYLVSKLLNVKYAKVIFIFHSKDYK